MATEVMREASLFLLDVMAPCEYTAKVATELHAFGRRYEANDVTEADLYLLNNLRVLVECAAEDFGCKREQDRVNMPAHDRNCVDTEEQAAKLQRQLDVIVARVETLLGGAGRKRVCGEGGAAGRADGARLAELLAQMAALVAEMQGKL